MPISSLPTTSLCRTFGYALRHLMKRKLTPSIEVKSYNLTLGAAYQKEQEKLLELVDRYQTIIFDGDGTLYKPKLFGLNWSHVLPIKLIQQTLKPYYFKGNLIEENELALLKHCLEKGKRIIIVTDNFNRSVAQRLQEQLSGIPSEKNRLVSSTKGPVEMQMLIEEIQDDSFNLSIIWAAQKDCLSSVPRRECVETLVVGDSKIDAKLAQTLGSDCLPIRSTQKDHPWEWLSIFGIINYFRVFRKQYVSSIDEALIPNPIQTKLF